MDVCACVRVCLTNGRLHSSRTIFQKESTVIVGKANFHVHKVQIEQGSPTDKKS